MFHKLIDKIPKLSEQDLQTLNNFKCPSCSDETNVVKQETKEITMFLCYNCQTRYLLEIKDVKDID